MHISDESIPSPSDLLTWAQYRGVEISSQNPITIGFSGGVDSTALLWLFSRLHAEGRGPSIHAVTVDHNLRPESGEEALRAGKAIEGWSGVKHHILHRPAPKMNTRILEKARQDRYRLLENFCQEQGVASLFVAHHADDQFETILFRLTKGSGLDGLTGMRDVSSQDSGVLLCRPLLTWPKQNLLSLCIFNNLPFIDDPSNSNTNYARPRIRSMLSSFQLEGLTYDRLLKSIFRLQRSAQAIDMVSKKVFQDNLLLTNTKRFVFKYSELKKWPHEIRLRVLQSACLQLSQHKDYGPRLNRLEKIEDKLFCQNPVRHDTLAGCLFTLHVKNDTLEIGLENS